MIKECNYCGTTGEYIEDGEICECGAGAEWISVDSGGGHYWSEELMLNNIDNVLEKKRSGIYY